MAGSYTARHDKAMRKVVKAALKGQQSNHHIIADVGKLPELQRLGVHSKRVPAFILPDGFIGTSSLEHQEEGDALNAKSRRDKMRPDIMTAVMTPIERHRYTQHPNMPPLCPNLPNGCARKVWIVEGGYCMDTRYVDKLHEKQEQHKELEASLRAYGYNVSVLPIILGFCGTIPNSVIEAMRALSNETTRANKLLLALHTHAITTLHATVTLRRRLEGCFKNRRSHKNRPN